MHYRNVGRWGLRISEVSIGGWVTMGGTIDEQRSQDIVRKALELGVNFIDLADVYERGEAERIVGNILSDYRRADLVVSSKVYWPMSEDPNDRGLSRKHIMESIDGTLERLDTDYVDIYFCHRYDETVPLEETVRAMDDLIRRGKILYWGTSVWEADQLERVHELCGELGAHRPIVEQPRYNLYDRHVEDEIMETADDLGMGLVVWSPLAQGMLTGKYNEGVPDGSRAAQTGWLDKILTDENIDRARNFTELAARVGYPPEQLALAWILTHDEVSSVITGASRPEHVESNVAAAHLDLEDDVVDAIEDIFPV